MTITINVEQSIIPQVIASLREAGLSYSRIAELLGISRATLYNRYLSRDKYLGRRKTRKTHIVVLKGGRPKGSKNKTKKEKASSFWTQEELRELMRIFGGSGWKQVARAVKEIAPQEKNLEALRRLAKKHAGKPISYICKALRGGAYYEELHRLEDEKWAEKHAVQQVSVTAEEMRKSDEWLRNMMLESGKLVSDEQLNKTTTIDDENEFCWLAERFGAEFAIDYFKEKKKKIPENYAGAGNIW